MANKWNGISKKLVHDQRHMCIYCWINTSDELAHALIHRRNSVPRKHKYINVEENAAPCCKGCQLLSETREGRLIAWAWLCKKFGTEHMRAWYDSLPFKIKEEMW